MSLSGLRDMSLIETPPSDRLAIQTQVVQSSDAVIKSAIDLELARGGQVFSFTTVLNQSKQLPLWLSGWCRTAGLRWLMGK